MTTEKKTEISISVRNLVEFILRSGDIESGFTGSSRAVEGTLAHKKVQNSYDASVYQAEVMLSHSIEYEKYILKISGRADGVLKDDDIIIIDEIKSTTKELNKINEDYNQLHWAQVMIYAYFYALENQLEEIGVQLTYYHLETEKNLKSKRKYTLKELEDYFQSIISQYIYWAEYSYNWTEERNKSIEELNFPHGDYRKGQRKLTVAVYKTVIEEKKLYVQAPTGIGKTISTLFPSIIAMGKKGWEKIFYLTAKTVTQKVVEENIIILHNNNLKLKSLTLTAKEKICFREESECSPEVCKYAKGHYDRVNNALKEILKQENIISREIIEEYAERYQVCPFEFSLDLSLWVDMVICDYNYVFDPTVGLKRFFADSGGNYVFLIDEAHNLVDRSREMYSAEIYLEDFIYLQEMLTKNRDIIKKDSYNRIIKNIDDIVEIMSSYRELVGSDFYIQKKGPDEYYSTLNRFINNIEEILVSSQKKFQQDIQNPRLFVNQTNKDELSEIVDILLEQYFAVLSFIRAMEIFDENFILYYQNISNGFSEYVQKEKLKLMMKIFCLNPSPQLKEILDKGKAAVFFSATLTPLKYHRKILGGNSEDYLLELSTPFSEENMKLLVGSSISTRYRQREKGYNAISEYIAEVNKAKKGNYLVFFSSYKYMQSVHEVFVGRYPDINTIIQSPDMSQEKRIDYLQQFNTEYPVTGFAILGGIFSEGIDLKGEKLLGTIVVGVAHPGLSLERDLIRDYYNQKKENGYEYAYLYPGINKVLQAGGRTIRTEKDRGIVFLIGERFREFRYIRLLPNWWSENMVLVTDCRELEENITEFWI